MNKYLSNKAEVFNFFQSGKKSKLCSMSLYDKIAATVIASSLVIAIMGGIIINTNINKNTSIITLNSLNAAPFVNLQNLWLKEFKTDLEKEDWLPVQNKLLGLTSFSSIATKESVLNLLVDHGRKKPQYSSEFQMITALFLTKLIEISTVEEKHLAFSGIAREL